MNQMSCQLILKPLASGNFHRTVAASMVRLIPLSCQIFDYIDKCIGEKLWGRGSVDDKSGLIGIL